MRKERARAEVGYEIHLDRALKRPGEAARYLNAALKDGDPRVFLLALRDVARACGMSRVARLSGLNRESLYRMLSRRGNPELNGLGKLLGALRLKLAVVPDLRESE